MNPNFLEINKHRGHQSSDYNAHLAYYDQLRLLSFTWDGRSEYIQVSHGGYGEPVRWAIQAPIFQCKPHEVVQEFEKHCRASIASYDEAYSEEGPDGDGAAYHALHPHCASMEKLNLPPLGAAIWHYKPGAGGYPVIFDGTIDTLIDQRWAA